MTGTLWGADVAQLRRLAQDFAKASDALLQQSAQLSNQINNNPAWKGNDAARFTSEWNSSHRALLMQTASQLMAGSKKLLEDANQQELASDAAPGSGGGPIPSGGPGGNGGASDNGLWGPEWMADEDSPFRQGWDGYNGVVGLKTVPYGLRDITHFAGMFGDEIRDLWRSGDQLGALRTAFNSQLWDVSQRADGLRGAFSGTADLITGNFGDFAQTARGADAAPLSGLSKFGLNSAGHVLGGLGVALDGLDTVNAVMDGETGDAIKSGLKTALGVGSFLPPPVGVTCMVIGGAWAAVELIPGAKDAIDDTFDAVGDFAEDTAKDIGEGVKNFFGF
ncbi:hypothetical protein [Arthrobacter sp. CJ23]|uniref:hypothetical protein n=1 Tax=Arthrobacter sp. CJ23 TaxID=2972479 RepID=UPI00215C9434|nr:hypothetical protein [Arthrobacter sp. CJ23]UVJ38604.1 hypothetical protein NVV90_15440 [Arthrobacter sp. CJ23]